MNPANPSEPDREYEIPCQPHPAVEIDSAEHFAAQDRVDRPVGGLVRDDRLLPPWEISGSGPVGPTAAVALALTLRLPDGADPHTCLQDVFLLMQTLNHSEIALGGQGLVLDCSLSL